MNGLDSSLTIESWLLRRGRSLVWNSKRTVAKSSVFNIPESLVILPNFQQYLNDDEDDEQQSLIDSSSNIVTIPNEKGTTCIACGLRFSDLSEQKSHFKSDFHLLNLKRRLRNLPTISQAEFENSKGDSSSYFGDKDVDDGDQLGDGDSSDSDADDDNSIFLESSSDTATEVDVDQSKRIAGFEQGLCIKSYSNKTGHQIQYRRADDQKYEIVFNSSALFTNNFIRKIKHMNKDDSLWLQLRNTMALAKESNTGAMWAVLILRSGRFAGAIFRKQEMIAHKVFRRYTVRAKAGGSQSSYDNQAGKANSMGAMLRRYGEQALKEDVQSLLLSWSFHLDTCTKLLLSVPKTMLHVLFEYPQSALQQAGALEPPLVRTDSRICHVPFMVSKPTLDEVRVVYDKCTSVIFRQIQQLNSKVANASNTSTAIGIDERTIDGTLKNSSASDSYEMTNNVDNDFGDLDAMLLSDLSFYEDNKQSILGTIHEQDESHNDTSQLSLPESELSRMLLQACREGNLASVKRIIRELQTESATSSATKDPDNSDDEEQEEGGEHSTIFNIDSNLYYVLGIPDSIESLQSPLHIASDLGNTDIVRVLLENGANPCQVDVRNRTAYHLAKTKPVRDAFRWVRGLHENRWNWDVAGVPTGLTAERERDQRDKEKEKKKRQKEKKRQEKERDNQEKELQLKEAQRQKQELIQRMTAPCDQCGKAMGIQAMVFLDKKVCSGACSLALRRKLAAEAALTRLKK